MTKRPQNISGLSRELGRDRRTIRRYVENIPPAGEDSHGWNTWKPADVAAAIAAKRDASGNMGRIREAILFEKVRGLRWKNDRRAEELVSVVWLHERMQLVLAELDRVEADVITHAVAKFAALGIPASRSEPILRDVFRKLREPFEELADEIRALAERGSR